MHNNIKKLEQITLYPNAWYLSQGYRWVKKHLHDNLAVLRSNEFILYKNILYDYYRILADINILTKSYKTSFLWNKRAFEIRNDSEELIDDLIYLAQKIGDEWYFNKYVNLYISQWGHERSFVYDFSLQENTNDLYLLHLLNSFHPNKLLKQLEYSDCHDTYSIFLKALCYGAIYDIPNFVNEIRKYLEKCGKLKVEDLYFFPIKILDSSTFWTYIVQNKIEISIMTCDFDILKSSKNVCGDGLCYRKEYENTAPQLHLARVNQDIKEIQKLEAEFPTWNDPKLCVSFFDHCKRMPYWKEFYSYTLSSINADNFL